MSEVIDRELCKCGCGQYAPLPYGCRKYQFVRGHNNRLRTKHCDNRRNQTAPEYAAWCNTIQRCTNPKNPAWANYGGRGIKVCAAWLDSYEAFLAHVGRRPSPKHSLDRHPNNDGNYEPGNVRWATRLEQSINSRRVRLVTHDGRTMHLAEWARETGINYGTLYSRLCIHGDLRI